MEATGRDRMASVRAQALGVLDVIPDRELELVMQSFVIECENGAEAEVVAAGLTRMSEFAEIDFDVCSEWLRKSFIRMIPALLQSSFRNVHIGVMKVIRHLPGSLIASEISVSDVVPWVASSTVIDAPHVKVHLQCLHVLLKASKRARLCALDNAELCGCLCSVLASVDVKMHIRKQAVDVIGLVVGAGTGNGLAHAARLCRIRGIFESVRSVLADRGLQLNLRRRIVFVPSQGISDKQTCDMILIELGFSGYFNQVLSEDDVILKEAAIEAVGRHYLYNSDMLHFDYRSVLSCASSDSGPLATTALWMLSNMIKCSPSALTFLEPLGLFQVLHYAQTDGTARMKMEGRFIMIDIICAGDPRTAMHCLDCESIPAFLDTLETECRDWCIQALRGLACLLKHRDNSVRQRARAEFTASSGISRLSALADSPIPEVSAAVSLFSNILVK